IHCGSFQPERCNFFREHLSYFFYGRPGYRLTNPLSIHIISRAPVVVVMAGSFMQHGKRMFSLDTGAFFDNRYATWTHGRMQLAHFELRCPSDAPQIYVTSFFGDNDAYLRVEARRRNLEDAGEFEAESMVALLTDRNNNAADDRRAALELQV